MSSWISPGFQRDCGGGASCPEPGSAMGRGFRPLGTMEGTCSCQGYCPLPSPFPGDPPGMEAPAGPGMAPVKWVISVGKCGPEPPLPGTAQDCSRLQGRLAESGQEHNGVTRKGKNQKGKIKQGSVGIPRE